MFQGAFRRAVSTSGSVWIVLILASCTSGSGSATTSGSSSATGANSITYPRVVDLSQVISPSIPLWPGDPHVVFKVVATTGATAAAAALRARATTCPASAIAASCAAVLICMADSRLVRIVPPARLPFYRTRRGRAALITA